MKTYVLQSIVSLNGEKKDDADFIQLLLIAFVTTPTHVDPIAIKLVKGASIVMRNKNVSMKTNALIRFSEFFMMRIQGDESRLENFNVLITAGIEELRRDR